MTHYNIPDNLVNDIVMMSRRKPLFVREISNICQIVTLKETFGLGDYRVIHYVADTLTKKKLYQLKTAKHYKVIHQLNHLISQYNREKEIGDLGDTGLGEWFKWWNYEYVFYYSGDRHYASSEYSSEDDDN